MGNTILPCILNITWDEYQEVIKAGYPYRGPVRTEPEELAPTMTEVNSR